MTPFYSTYCHFICRVAIDLLKRNILVFHFRALHNISLFVFVFIKYSYLIKIKARTVVGAGKSTDELVARTNREILPVVRLLRVDEADAFTALLRWDRPTNADKFKEYTMKYIVSIQRQIFFLYSV